MGLVRIFYLVFLVVPSLAPAADFRLAFPVDCTLGKDCVIQNYVDLDSGDGWRDYNCGTLTYDGHKGTDIRIRDYRSMAEGVAVLAAADGVVLGSRNSIEDRPTGSPYNVYLKKISGKECGNGVVLVHDDDYQTQYCHLKKGSVTVNKGRHVSEGDVLGFIGMSGKTQFPHLHISVRKGGEVIGPFIGRCSAATRYLWKDDISYTGTHLLKYGFSDAPQTLESIEEAMSLQLSSKSGALLFWANVVGIRKGDRQEITINRPDGSQLTANSQTIESSKVNWLSYVGKKRPLGGWPPGIYTAVYTIDRGPETVVRQEAVIEVR